MKKNDYINVRINEKTKQEAEEILKNFDLRISDAVNIFLNQVIAEKGIPFMLKQPKYDKAYHELKRAITYNSFGGGIPSKYAENILRLYATGLIDFETAKFALGREGMWETHIYILIVMYMLMLQVLEIKNYWKLIPPNTSRYLC